MSFRLALLFLLSLRIICPAMDADALLAKGNQLYSADQFAEAKAAYEQALAEGPRASVLTNLGNAHYRMGEIGHAALAYERALVLEPGFEDAAANLKLIREKAGSRIAGSAFWESPLLLLRTPLAFRMAEACVAFSILAALWGSTHRERRGWLWAAAGVQCIIVALGTASWLAWKRHAEFAIVTSSAADARIEPADRASLAEPLLAGSRVRVLRAHGAWTHCLLPGGARGWLLSKSVETIHP